MGTHSILATNQTYTTAEGSGIILITGLHPRFAIIFIVHKESRGY